MAQKWLSVKKAYKKVNECVSETRTSTTPLSVGFLILFILLLLAPSLALGLRSLGFVQITNGNLGFTTRSQHFF